MSDADPEKAHEAVLRWSSQVWAFGVGNPLWIRESLKILRWMRSQGARVFLDLKWHDSPSAVASVVRACVPDEPWGMTLHCLGGYSMLRESVSACQQESEKLGVERPLLFGVTVPEHLPGRELYRMGMNRTVESQIKRLSVMALDACLDGVVCPPYGVEAVRKACGTDFLVIADGVREDRFNRASERVMADFFALEEKVFEKVTKREVIQHAATR